MIMKTTQEGLPNKWALHVGVDEAGSRLPSRLRFSKSLPTNKTFEDLFLRLAVSGFTDTEDRFRGKAGVYGHRVQLGR